VTQSLNEAGGAGEGPSIVLGPVKSHAIDPARQIRVIGHIIPMEIELHEGFLRNLGRDLAIKNDEGQRPDKSGRILDDKTLHARRPRRFASAIPPAIFTHL
jgi:hypothetical protein